MYRYVLVLLLLVSSSFANENCSISSIKKFYHYVRDNGPILGEINKKKEQIRSEIDLAKQRPNPAVNIDYLKGKQFGINVDNYSLSVQHVIELGAKRDKRVAKAEAFKSLGESQLDLDLYRANFGSALIYQKTAQLEIILESVREASITFSKVINKLASRKRLNPEETVSLSTLRLASNDYKAQLNNLENQKNIFEGELEFLTQCEELRPKYYDFIFPEKSSLLENQKGTGLLKLEDYKVDLSDEELKVQESLGYSNIQIGPSVEYQTQGKNEFISAGVAVSFALPLFHTNNGGKLKAISHLRSQKVESFNAKKMLLIERKKLVKKYERSLKTLKEMPTLKELDQKHLQVEDLFSRGVVSIPMTIESHRQQVDFLKARFATENDLLATYIKINLIDGDLRGFEKLIK